MSADDDYIISHMDSKSVDPAVEDAAGDICRQHEITLIDTALNSEAGRALAWFVLEQAGLWQTQFTGDAEGTIFRTGRHSVGLNLMAEIMRNPPIYTRIEREAVQRKEYARERAKSLLISDE